MEFPVDNELYLPIEKFSKTAVCRTWDSVADEQPLKIVLEWGPADSRKAKTISYLMRTPGDDTELALGFLFTEGVIGGARDISQIDIGYEPSETNRTKKNRAHISLKTEVVPQLEHSDRFSFSASSCGMCGKISDPLDRDISSVRLPDELSIDPTLFFDLPRRLSLHQQNFHHNGGLHAAALFSSTGIFLDIREDIGRHNAVDKVIGARLQEDRSLNSTILLVSGRVSLEIIQKSAIAQIPVIVALGAPSKLAIDFASYFDLSLIGFLKAESFNLYSGAHRIVRRNA